MSDDTPDLRKLLQTNLDDVKEPPLLPAGSYTGIIVKHTFGQTKSEKKTPFVEFAIQLTGHGADVAEEDVADVDWSKKQMRFTFYLTADSLFRIKDFLTKLDIPTAGRTLDVAIPETINRDVLLSVIQKPRQNEAGKFFNEIKEISAHV